MDKSNYGCSGAKTGSLAHVPDELRLPQKTRAMPWKLRSGKEIWPDGQLLLVAVPVNNGTEYADVVSGSKGWHYELAVLRLSVGDVYEDEDGKRWADGVEWELDGGEQWGWQFEDVDWFIELN